MKKTIILITLILMMTSVFAAVSFDPLDVVVGYSGAWQLGVDPQQNLKLEKDGTGRYCVHTSLDGWDPSVDYEFDTDNPAESAISLTHLNNFYQFSFKESGVNNKEIIINLMKNGKACGGTNGNVVKQLHVTDSDDVTEYENDCGLFLRLNWERFVIESDVEMEKLCLTDKEFKSNEQKFLNFISKSGAQKIIEKTALLNQKFRAFEVNNPLQFKSDPEKKVYILAEDISFWKDRWGWFDDGKGYNSAIITKDGKILYVIYIKNTIVNEFAIYKPKKQLLLSSYKDFAELENALLLRTDIWEQVTDKKEISEESALLPTAIGGVVAYSAMSTAVVAGNMAAGYTFLSSASVLVSNPVGWVILGIGATGSVIGYTVYHFTDTDTFSYDGGRLVFNYDSTFWQRIFASSEGEINFVAISEGGLNLPSSSSTSVEEDVVCDGGVSIIDYVRCLNARVVQKVDPSVVVKSTATQNTTSSAEQPKP